MKKQKRFNKSNRLTESAIFDAINSNIVALGNLYIDTYGKKKTCEMLMKLSEGFILFRGERAKKNKVLK